MIFLLIFFNALHIYRKATEENQIPYEDFVRCLNWRDHPVASVTAPTGHLNDSWQGNQPENSIQSVNYQALLQDVFGQ